MLFLYTITEYPQNLIVTSLILLTYNHSFSNVMCSFASKAQSFSLAFSQITQFSHSSGILSHHHHSSTVACKKTCKFLHICCQTNKLLMLWLLAQFSGHRFCSLGGCELVTVAGKAALVPHPSIYIIRLAKPHIELFLFKCANDHSRIYFPFV
jgi:hypothetical protein